MEIVFDAKDVGSRHSFNVIRRDYHKTLWSKVDVIPKFNGYSYALKPGIRLSRDYANRMIELARVATLEMGHFDDLDTVPIKDGFSFSVNRLLVTHSLEHLTVFELCNLSPAADYTVLRKNYNEPDYRAAITTVYGGNYGRSNFGIEFSLSKDLGHSEEEELQAVRNAALRMAELG